MENNFIFDTLCYTILFHFLLHNEVKPWARRQCRQLMADFSDMDLRVIPDDIPNSRLKSLNYLDLTRCGITFMYEDIFKYQPDLAVLILIGNPLVFITERAFTGPLARKYLSLAQSKIQSLSDIPSDNLAYLEVLDLGGSEIRSLDGLSSFHCQSLRNLQLDMNSIDRINVPDLAPLHNVHGMSISFKGNYFVYTEPGLTFSNLQNLKTLNLSWSNTSLTNVHIFKGLKNLQLLNLKGNTIQGGVLSLSELFEDVPLLEILILSSCNITALEENLFKGLTHLKQIDLSENKLVKLSTSGFYSLHFLQLNLASNAIVTVDVGSVMDLGNKSTVDLRYNPLVCNCSNFEFINWATKNLIKVKHLMETVCNATGTRIIDAELQCEFPVGVLAFVIILVAIIITFAIFCLARRISKYSRYSQL
uniref:LRRCT domain-containing protein n=1 Tax=Sinocyclocheilus grahami TaxID=75366 RepID=A0A672KTI7_SINGR